MGTSRLKRSSMHVRHVAKGARDPSVQARRQVCVAQGGILELAGCRQIGNRLCTKKNMVHLGLDLVREDAQQEVSHLPAAWRKVTQVYHKSDATCYF